MCDVMRNQVGLRYRKIIRLAPQTNSPRCLILRQQSALVFLKLFQSKRRLINIDESWLDAVRYQRRCWQPKEGCPGERQINIKPRITLIAAIDNHGAVLLSLLQANSDEEIMELYLT